jgi:hypothetical protein
MKGVISIFFLLITKLSFAQKQSLNFSYIDRKVQSIEACAPDSLAEKLSASYVTDVEKIRSIFRWITENIAYRTKNYPGSRKGAKYLIEPEDTLSASLNERIAIEVLRKKEAVCDGYARLFKTLCDYAGIRSEIITGYARPNMTRMGEQFKSNHRWNAVLADSNWYLLDATWSSGYITYNSDQFVKAYDDYYFMTPPEDFIRDHYPEDSRWTLLTNPPTLREFYRTPFRHSAFAKYSILSFAPMKGIIEATIGDTVNVELTMADIDRREIAPDTLKEDVAILPQTHMSDFLSPSIGNDSGKISYRYPITTNNVEWLNIMYNDDIILRYKLNIRKNKDD